MEELPIKYLDLIAIGYWKSELEPNLPYPSEFQDENWNQEEKEMILNHLNNGILAIKYRGVSWCRFNCDEINMGTKCLTDGKYIFPEKLTHYIEFHNVRLPKKFVEHVKNFQPIEERFDVEVNEINYSWWKKIKLKNGLVKTIFKNLIR